MKDKTESAGIVYGRTFGPEIILALYAKSKPTSPSEISKELDRPISTVSQILSYFEEGGLATEITGKYRGKRYILTVKGEGAAKAISEWDTDLEKAVATALRRPKGKKRDDNA